MSENTESNKIDKILATLTPEQKTNMIIQSFYVGAGSNMAHTMYAYWLSEKLSLTPIQTKELIKKTFDNLDPKGTDKLYEIASTIHIDKVKKTDRQLQENDQFPEADLSTSKKRFLFGTRMQLPDLTFNEEEGYSRMLLTKVRDIQLDETYNANGQTTRELRKAAAELGFYSNTGIKWFDNLPANHPLKQKG